MVRLLRHPILLTVVSFALAAAAVVVLEDVSGIGAIVDALTDFQPQWLGLVAGAEIVSYLAYVVASQSLAAAYSHERLPWVLWLEIVISGFGPFEPGGGFALDRRALRVLHDDVDGATERVLGLGALEWALLAPAGCISAIVLLADGRGPVQQSLLWPWALAVPVGFGIGLWLSAPRRRERVATIRGRQRRWLSAILHGVGVLHTVVRHPLKLSGAWIGMTIYWSADILALYGSCRAFGMHISAPAVILAYATGYAATRRSLPLAGAGATEALMTLAFGWVGKPLAASLCAVVLYRVFNFLAIVPVGYWMRGHLMPKLAEAERKCAPPEALTAAGRIPRRD
jgi:uncharacterized membrane protein YbhN (UPF0104 family)